MQGLADKEYSKTCITSSVYSNAEDALSASDLSTVVFEGTKWEEKIPFPIAMAPVGVLRIFNLDGEMAAIMAAAKEKVPYISSTASSPSIEDVARANGEGGMR